MIHFRKIQYRLCASILTAVLLFPMFAPTTKTPPLLSWWGTIYPQFCFMEKPEEDTTKVAKPIFHFWFAETIRKLLY